MTNFISNLHVFLGKDAPDIFMTHTKVAFVLGFVLRRLPPELVFVTLGIRGIGSKACFPVVDFKQIAMLVSEVEIAVRAVSHSQWRRHRFMVLSLAALEL